MTLATVQTFLSQLSLFAISPQYPEECDELFLISFPWASKTTNIEGKSRDHRNAISIKDKPGINQEVNVDRNLKQKILFSF